MDAISVGISYRPNFREFCLSEDGRRLIGHLEMPIENITGYGTVSASAMRLSRQYPVILHGVSQSFGSESFPSRSDSVRITQQAVELLRPAWVGDHISTSLHQGGDSRQLLPVERSEEMAKEVAGRANSFRRAVGVPVVLEYIAHAFDPGGPLTESEFIRSVMRETECGLLLDLHNIYANSMNFGFDPFAFLAELPMDRVTQIHIAGGETANGFYFDSHNSGVPDVVWGLLSESIARTGSTAITLERDDPAACTAEIIADLEKATHIAKDALRGSPAHMRNSTARPMPAKTIRHESKTTLHDIGNSCEHSRKSRTCATIRRAYPFSWEIIENQIVNNWRVFEKAGERYASAADKASAALSLVAETLPAQHRWRADIDAQLSRLIFAEDSEDPIVVEFSVENEYYVLRRNSDLTITVKRHAVC
ncbi:DUF692 family multinuclear iron-containing protein [Nocardia sp. NPDC058658]|uniref:DUF692 domain-containing protein n=1 Tax=Nocardia sp. NPDC058658 TaxID=3346580 RepID=UPI00364C2C02